ncbi:MAG: PAS domain S-box protein [Methanomassiliicoccales archaeon]
MIHLLCVDDEPDFLEITKLFLEAEGDFEVITVTNTDEAEKIIWNRIIDAIVCDYQMPGKDGLEFLGDLRSKGCTLPFILFTGKGREEVAIMALNLGADRYIQKGHDLKAQFKEVAHAVRMAVKQRKDDEAIKNKEARLSAIFRAAPIGIGLVSDRILIEVNDRLCEMLGYKREDLLGKSARVLYPTDDDFNYVGKVKYSHISECGSGSVETKWLRKDGKVLDILLSSTAIDPQNLKKGVVFTALDITTHKKTLQELKLSEERWKFALEGSGDGIFDWDIENDKVFFSIRWKQILGYNDDEIENEIMEWKKRIHPDDIVKVMLHLDAHLKGETNKFEMEYRLQCKDGNYKWILARGMVIERCNGRPIRMLGTHSDITNRKIMEIEKLESEQRFRAIFQSMNEGMALHELIYDQEGNAIDYRILAVNPRYEKILGLKAIDVVGKLATQVYQVAQAPFLNEYQEVVKTGLAKELDVFYEPLMKYFHISVASLGSSQFVTIFFDTTALKILEREMAEREAQLRLVTDNMEDIVYQTDEEDRVVFVSPSITRKLGCRIEDIVGKKATNNIHDEDSEIIWRQYTSAIAAHEPKARMEMRYRASSGEYIWLETEMRFIYGHDGRFKGCVGVARDISDRKMAESAAALANKKLRLLNSVTRHDVINQIVILKGFLEIDSKILKDTQIKEHFEKMKHALSNIQNQIDFMHDYQIMGETSPHWQSLREVFLSALSEFQLKDVEVNININGVDIFADRLLKKVFQNLIDNSLRHGGGITKIELSVHYHENFLNIIYNDDGEGIHPDEKKRIFELGYGKNTGFGLFLTKEILELTGISIEECGEFGKGVKFIIRVPFGVWRLKSESIL